MREKTQQKFPVAYITLLVFAGTCSTQLAGASLLPETLAAWKQYLAVTEQRLQESLMAGSFLAIDKSQSDLQAVQRGKIVAHQVKPLSEAAIPHGLLHDWLGTVFVPNAALADVLNASRDYEKYPEWYGPTIADVRLTEKRGDTDRFTVRYVRHVLWVKAVMEIDYETQFFQVTKTQWYAICQSTRIQQVGDYRKFSERKLDPDSGNGYVWRVCAITKYQERDNGVYIEQESIGLSRPIPSSARLLVEPVVKRLARDLLETTLAQTRSAVSDFEHTVRSYRQRPQD